MLKGFCEKLVRIRGSDGVGEIVEERSVFSKNSTLRAFGS